jgi:YebC/PmpR family DNA-binding regulatory protein
MSGHSKWSTIKRAKGIQDSKRSKIFAKISRDIITAVKLSGVVDINSNSLLKLAVSKAKQANMPQDKIERAINRGSGVFDGDNRTLERTYEILSEAGAILVDCETDNPNRTLTDIRTITTKSGYKLLPEGSVSWKFQEVGYIKITSSKNVNNFDDLLLDIIDIAEPLDSDLSDQNQLVLYYNYNQLSTSHAKIAAFINSDYDIAEVGILKRPTDILHIEPEIAKKLMGFIMKLEEIEEVIAIWKEYNDNF